jgi:hypothetical protein
MEWEEDSDGNVTLCPLTGAAVADVTRMSVAVRLEYLSRSAEGDEVGGAVQLVMKADEAIRIGELLRKVGLQILAQSKPSLLS